MRQVRIIAPARSLKVVGERQRKNAEQRLEELGFTVTYGDKVYSIDSFDTSPAPERIQDLHEAYLDSKVNLIMAATGGFSSLELLDHIDYDLIKANPKPLCGYSDITALHNAIYEKTGQENWLGPNLSTLGMEQGLEYTIEMLRKAMQGGSFKLTPSSYWSDDAWYQDQENRHLIDNQGTKIINPGNAQGKIIGGNLTTLLSLAGTQYFPKLKARILLIEEDKEEHPHRIRRNIAQLSQQTGFSELAGILIGRYQNASNMNIELIKEIFEAMNISEIPTICDLDFGHTEPTATIPIGGYAIVQENEITLQAQGLSNLTSPLTRH